MNGEQRDSRRGERPFVSRPPSVCEAAAVHMEPRRWQQQLHSSLSPVPFAAELRCPPACLLVLRAAALAAWGRLSVRLLGAAAGARRVPTGGRRCGDYLRQH